MSLKHKSIFTGHIRDLTSTQESGFTSWRAGTSDRHYTLHASSSDFCCLTVSYRLSVTTSQDKCFATQVLGVVLD